MEKLFSPEVLRPAHEFRPELCPERDLCLKSIVAQASNHLNQVIDLESDHFLLDYLDRSVVGDAGEGITMLGCLEEGCGATCIVGRTQGLNGQLEVLSYKDLDDYCIVSE
jgi:hypothetical protein